MPILHGAWPSSNWARYNNSGSTATFITYKNKFLILGGFAKRPIFSTKRCFAYHITLGELEEIPSLPFNQCRMAVNHQKGNPIAYLVGGELDERETGIR